MIKTTIAAALISLTALAAVPAQASGFSVQVGVGPGWSDNGHGRDGYGPSDHSGRGWRDDGRRHDLYRYRMTSEEMRVFLRQSGFTQIRFIDHGERVDRILARWDGDSYLLLVSRFNGEILSRQRI